MTTPEMNNTPTKADLTTCDNDIENIFTLPDNSEQIDNIFNLMEKSNEKLLTTPSEMTFSPNNFLKHFNIFSAPTPDMQQEVAAETQTPYTNDTDIASQVMQKQDNEESDNNQINPLNATVQETVQALDFHSNNAPGHDPVMLPINTILRTNCWYHINEQGVLTSTLETSDTLTIQGDIIHKYDAKMENSTQTDNSTMTEGATQTEISLQSTETQTTPEIINSSTQTNVDNESVGIQHSPSTEDKATQNTITTATTSMEMGTNTDNNIKVPMYVTLNMGNAHELPKWEWP
jgi:hypothetical protein